MKAITCINYSGGIGKNGKIPWHSKEDLQHFKKITMGNGNNAVVMGHRTFVSLGCRPLKGRRNIVLTRDPMSATTEYREDVIFECNPSNIKLLENVYDEIYVIGGEIIYTIFLDCYDEVYLTLIDNYETCDTYFPLKELSDYEETHISSITDSKRQELHFFKYTKKKNRNYI